jgi:hypothetical protein
MIKEHNRTQKAEIGKEKRQREKRAGTHKVAL